MSRKKLRPPGPKGPPIIGVGLTISKDTPDFLTRTAKEFQDLSYFKVLNLHMYYLCKPEYVQHVLQENNKNFYKSVKYKFLKLFLGQGLLTSEGEFWLKQRRLAQPAFHKHKIASFAETMTGDASDMMAEWEKGIEKGNDVVDMHREMMALTLRIVGKTLLSKDLKTSSIDIDTSLGYLIADIFKRVHSVFDIPLWVPIPRNIGFKKARKVLDDVINKIIDDRLSGAETGACLSDRQEDLLSMLIGAEDEDTGEKMPKEQLRDEVMTIFVAGHETTANALTWTLYLLSTHSSVMTKLKAELDEVLDGRTPGLEDSRSLKYTTQVIEESMRLYPPAWIIERTAIGDDKIGDYEISKGDQMIMSPYVMHRDPKYWKEPNTFDPERFSEEGSKERDRYCYFPFGGGPRYCIGANFAMLEMQLVLASICQNYSFSVKEGFHVETEPLVTLRPKNGMPMVLKKISA
ncbi:MAG TPA: cytochrome P450 [Flavobacteriales bacterium]|nr:cytochrome P450 [Flavobacteriales bacterium]